MPRILPRIVAALGCLLLLPTTGLAGEVTVENGSLSGKTIHATVANSGTTLQTVQVGVRYNDGNKLQDIVVNVKVGPGQSVPFSVKVKGPNPGLLTITDDIDPMGAAPGPGEVIVGMTEGPDPIPN